MAPKLPNYLNKKEVKLENTVNTWTVCPKWAKVKKSRRISKKVRLHYQMAVEQFEKSNGEGTAPIRPAHLDSCLNCSGSGLVAAISLLFRIQNYPCGYYWWRYRRSSSSCSLLAPGIPPFTNAITASKLDLRAMDSLCNKLVKQSKDWVFSH
jgi:hypothetical protein